MHNENAYFLGFSISSYSVSGEPLLCGATNNHGPAIALNSGRQTAHKTSQRQALSIPAITRGNTACLFLIEFKGGLGVGHGLLVPVKGTLNVSPLTVCLCVYVQLRASARNGRMSSHAICAGTYTSKQHLVSGWSIGRNP